jgi:cellulose synthase (UDP-forming)
MFTKKAENPLEASRHIENHVSSPTVSTILLATTLGAIAYLVFLLQPQYRGDMLPYLMVILSEIFLILNGLVSFWTILSGRADPRSYGYHSARSKLFGMQTARILSELNTETYDDTTHRQLYLHGRPVRVDVYIPTYGEPVHEVRATALAAQAMYGLHETYILDDGKSDQVQAMARSIGVRYIRRPSNEHAKAGNINYALSQTKGDYFVILDADFVADKTFLIETLPFFDDDKVAFVQTPQYYDNHNNFVSSAAGFMQHVFYALVQAGKNKFNAAFCVGTNVIFRRSAILEMGGIYSGSKSEDIWTSMILHERGYRSIYLNKVLAIGKTPETLKAYSKQQLRWATGSFEIFMRRNPLLNNKLTTDQRIQYFATTAFYFNGFAVATLLLLPVLQIYFNLTPIALDIPFYQWALLYSGFYGLQLILSMYTMGGFRINTLMLSAASFPIYIKAGFNVLRGRDEAWQATNRVDAYDSPFNYIRVQTYIFIFLLLATTVGIWKSLYTHEFSVSIVWCALNMIIFGHFTMVALRESWQMNRAVKRSTVRNRKLTTFKEARAL